MRLVSRITVEDVLAELRRGRDCSKGSGPWTVRLVELADAQYGPDWWDAELSAEEAAAVVLPAHAGEPCRGDVLTLVDAHGSTPIEAAARFAAIEADYARANASCWSRIDQARREPITRVILSVAPLDREEYRDLATGPRLYCVDGLHRLIGWALAGTLAAAPAVPTHLVAAASGLGAGRLGL